MSEEKPLEFSARDLMPDWAQEKPREAPQDYARRFGGGDEPRERRGGDRRDDRRGGGFGGRGGERRGGPGGGERRFEERRGGSGGGERRGGERRGEGRSGERRFEDRSGGGRPEGDRGDRGGRGDRAGRSGERRPGRDFRDDRGGRGGRDRDRPREEPMPVGIAAVIEPSGPAVEGLVRHIRETFRSFPVGDLAKLLLEARERYRVRFTASEPARLHTCVVDGSLWLSREEAISHLLSGPALEAYYVAEDLAVEPPAGNFGVVAVCGMSGTILGPPNHHEYQRNVARLHRERFSDMSLERFKSRIRMESGEEILEKWKEQVSRVRQYRVKPAAPASAPGSGADDEVAKVEAEAAPAALPEETAVPTNPDETADIVGENGHEAAVGESAAEPSGETAGDEAPDEALREEAAPESESGESTTAEPATAESEDSAAEETAALPAEPEGPVLKSIEEVARHFRQHFADSAVFECGEAVVPGNVSGRLLSPGLLALLKQEGERLRRTFPLPLMQALCRAFEERGLKFYKRGKKSLHVAAVRPKALEEGAQLTDAIRAIVDYVAGTPKPNVAGLLEALVPGFKKPEGAAVEESAEWSDAARAVLKDLRWLTAEGYLLEFPDTGLALGRENRPDASAAGGGAPAGQAEAKKKAKRAGREGKADSAKPANSAVAPRPSSARDDLDEEDFVLPALPPEGLVEGDPDDPYELPDSVDPVVTF